MDRRGEAAGRVQRRRRVLGRRAGRRRAARGVSATPTWPRTRGMFRLQATEGTLQSARRRTRPSSTRSTAKKRNLARRLDGDRAAHPGRAAPRDGRRHLRSTSDVIAVASCRPARGEGLPHRRSRPWGYLRVSRGTVGRRRSRRRSTQLLADSPEVTVANRAEFIAQQTAQFDQLLDDDPDPAGAGDPDRGARHHQHPGPVGAGTDPRAGPAAGDRAAPGADDADDHRRGGGDLGLRRAARPGRRHRPRRRGGAGAEGRGHHRAGVAVDARWSTYLVLAAMVGVVAAVLPAIRAARVNVLQAIAHE